MLIDLLLLVILLLVQEEQPPECECECFCGKKYRVSGEYAQDEKSARDAGGKGVVEVKLIDEEVEVVKVKEKVKQDQAFEGHEEDDGGHVDQQEQERENGVALSEGGWGDVRAAFLHSQTLLVTQQ